MILQSGFCYDNTFLSITADRNDSLLSGEPTLTSFNDVRSCCLNCGHTDSAMYRREHAEHFCPEYSNAERIVWLTTLVRSADLCTKWKFFPPHSTHNKLPHYAHGHSWHDTWPFLTWHVAIHDMIDGHSWHDTWPFMTWYMAIPNMTRGHSWHDRWPFMTWHMAIHDMIHSHSWHDTWPFMTWHVAMPDMTHGNSWHHTWPFMTW